jgi:hypothetical protein
MTTPSSSSGTGGQWQNETYTVENCQPLYQPNQLILPAAANQPIVASGVQGTLLGGAGQYAGLTVIPVSAYSGYEFAMGLACAVGPTVSGQITRVDMYWFDSLGDYIPVEHIRWDCPASNTLSGPSAPGFTTWGRGPHTGNWMAVTFTNKTNTSSMEGYFSLSGTTRNWTSHDWRSDGGISSQSASAATPYTNELCIASPAVGANSSAQRQIFLYSGEAFLHIDSPATGTFAYEILDDDNNVLVNQHPGEGNSVDEYIKLPRKICYLDIINTGGAAGTPNVALTADRI